jgi:hypothetical protein
MRNSNQGTCKYFCSEIEQCCRRFDLYQSYGLGGLKVPMTWSITSLRSIFLMKVNLHCIIICVLALLLTILSVAQIITSYDNISNDSIGWRKPQKSLDYPVFRTRFETRTSQHSTILLMKRNISIIKPKWRTFHSICWESKASTCFEHCLLILSRRYTNSIWYIACV